MIIETLATGLFIAPLIAFFWLLVGVTEAAGWTVRALGRWHGRRSV